MGRRSNRDETRRVLVQAGLDALRAHGLSVGMQSVSLERVHADADIPRSTAYAAWSEVASDDQTPQEAFRREVLREAIQHPVDENEIEIALEAIAGVDLDGLNGDEDQRRATRRELIRRGTGANAATIAASWRWWITSAVHSSLASHPPDERDLELLQELSRAENDFQDTTVEQVYAPYAELLGLRPRYNIEGDDGLQAFVLAASALGEGLARRYLIGTTSIDPLDVHIEGEPEPWTLYAMGMEALIDYFFEEIPDDER